MYLFVRIKAILLGVALATSANARSEDLQPLLTSLKAVGREGSGNVEAARAWRKLSKADASALPEILTAWDNADPTAANWLRTAVDVIAQRTLAAKKPLPVFELEAFVRQPNHNGAARRLAYEWLVRVDPAAPSRLLSGMLNDPSLEMRRDAIAVAIKDGQTLVGKDKDAGRKAFEKALTAARDRDQVEALNVELKKLGAPVDLAKHFNFVQSWSLIGPFDNSKGKGFDKAYPPETGVDLQATYEGKKGSTIRWTPGVTVDPFGMVDLNKQVGKHMGAVAYAFAEVESTEARPVQIRVGSNNAVKIYLNGKPLFAREEYHHGIEMDQYVGQGELKAGKNQLLLKVCQNEQTDSWAQLWSFQLRLTDAVGGAIPVRVVAATPSQKEKP
ncbi:hypothetical protein BH10PLA2_BH10PLA2_08550 [soil metagenome]